MDPIERASQEIFRVFLAEHWARFYFAVEQDGVVFLDVPAEALAAFGDEDKPIAEFIGGLNGRPVDMETSRRSIGEFVFKAFEGGGFPTGTVAKAFDSKPFGLLMRLFSVWLSGHEALLDTEVLPFAEWDRLFSAWRQDPAVVRFAASLAETPDAPASSSIH
jgi:hypothetical protein